MWESLIHAHDHFDMCVTFISQISGSSYISYTSLNHHKVYADVSLYLQGPTQPPSGNSYLANMPVHRFAPCHAGESWYMYRC